MTNCINGAIEVANNLAHGGDAEKQVITEREIKVDVVVMTSLLPL